MHLARRRTSAFVFKHVVEPRHTCIAIDLSSDDIVIMLMNDGPIPVVYGNSIIGRKKKDAWLLSYVMFGRICCEDFLKANGHA